MTKTLKIISIKDLTASTYVMRFERAGTPFKTGQHILLGTKGDVQAREYSIYSGEHDDYFEVLIKEVEDGIVSKKLKRLKPGDSVKYENPVGYFTIEPESAEKDTFLFIASGTGIAPFHSFVRTYPDLNYKILHGVRFADEAYEQEHYAQERITICSSRDDKGDFSGRVTDWLRQHPVDHNIKCYLCGNCEMIHEAYDILLEKGIPSENLHAEVYF